MRAASRTLRTAWVAAALLALPAACRPVSLPSIFTGMEERTEWVMGTRLRIVVPASARSEETLVLAFAAARELDALLSDYQPQTPLARLNATAGAPFAVVDPRLFAFLRRAVEDARRTEGLFDIAVGALVQGYRRGTIVDAKTLKDARSRSGSRLIELEAPNRARLAWPGVRLDPGGIGKGYAVDAIVAVLRARRVDRAFVDFGGSSVFGLGAPPERRGWPVLVPGVEPERPLGILWLKDEGFSSSESMPPPDAHKPKLTAKQLATHRSRRPRPTSSIRAPASSSSARASPCASPRRGPTPRWSPSSWSSGRSCSPPCPCAIPDRLRSSTRRAKTRS